MLALGAVLVLCPWMIHAQQGESTNLALGKPFSCTDPSAAGWDGLVDGVKTSDEKPGCFATGGGPTPKAVTVDLGEVCQTNRVDVINSLNGNTRAVTLEYSIDGKEWPQLREYVFPDQQLQTLTHRFPPTPARYVRITFEDTYGGGFGGDNFAFLRELEVYGKPKPGGAAATPSRPPVMDAVASRELQIFARHALREGARLKLAVLGDRVALGVADGGRGMGEVLAELIAERHEGVEIEVLQFSKEDMTVEDAYTAASDVADADPDMCIVALGATDSLDWQETAFRQSVSDLLLRLQRRTRAVLIAVSPPPFAGDPEKGLAEETAGKNTTDAVLVLRGIGTMMGTPVVDAGGAFEKAAIDRLLLYDDNIRPSELGHTVIARKILELLK